MPKRIQLAEIISADVLGYSRLICEDETGRLRALCNDLFKPAVASHRGAMGGALEGRLDG